MQVNLQIQQILQAKGISLADILKPEFLDARKELIIWLKENTTMSGLAICVLLWYMWNK